MKSGIRTTEISLAATIIGALLFACTQAQAGTTTVEDFRGTVQTITTTGVQTVALGANTTIVRYNASSTVEVVGIDGGADGRVVLLWNVGSASVIVYNDNSNASAEDRVILDANGGSRALYSSGVGLGLAVYDGTSSRWRFSTLEGFNSTGPLTVQGDLSTTASLNVYSTITAGGSITGGNATLTGTGNRLVLKALNSGNNSSNVRWQNSSGSSLFTMGPDYSGNAGQNFYLYDNVNALSNLYVDNAGTSWLSFGTSYGGVQWDETTQELGLFAQGYVALRVGGPSGGSIKTNGSMYHRRYLSGSLPVKGSNCSGSGTATQHADSSDSRGSVTLGTGATACTLTFDAPWDDTFDNSNQGFPICVANSSTSGNSVAVTSITDHAVTFTPSASGTQTIYYHCDGIEPPTL